MTPFRQQIRPNSLPDRSTTIHLALLSVSLGALYYMYQYFGVTDVGYDIHDTTRSAFRWLYERWLGDWQGTKFAHSHWVPLVSLILVWADRKTISRLPRQTNFLGLAVILIGLTLHWAGVKSQQTRLTILSMVVLSWGIPFFVCGWPVAKRLVFPCGFLIFSLPLNFFDAAAYPLRMVSTSIASGLLNGIGITVERSGSIINVDEGLVNLADSRSSIFAVTAVVAFSALCAYLINADWWKRVLLLVASIPLLIAANSIRGIAGIILLKFAGAEAGALAFRHASGPIICLFSFGVTGFAAWKLHDGDQEAAVRFNSSNSKSNPGSTPALIIVLLLIVSATAWIPTNLTIKHIEASGINLDWPDLIRSWHGDNLLYCHNPDDQREVIGPDILEGDPCPICTEPLFAMAIAEKALLPPDTIVRKKQYARYEGQNRIQLAVVLSGKDRSSIHRPEVCLVGPGSEILRSYVHEVSLSPEKTLRVRVLDILMHVRDAEGNTRKVPLYFTYWFYGDGKETPSHIKRMIWMAIDRLFKNRSSRWAYLSVSGLRHPDSQGHLREIDEFIKDIYPSLHPVNL